ncbi:oxidoreductase-like protein [Coniochaeta sp. 2T2.1]|nr:oxidoreductase-like protein [Coniochaeta sp. 2T2.1]
MRRTILTPRAARSLAQTLVQRQTRRTFATPPIKSQTPPEPLDRPNEQAMPLGPYYESIIHNPQPIPEKKPEQPPTSAPEQDAPTPPSKSPRGRKPKDDSTSKALPSSLSASPPIPTPSSDTPPTAEARARVVFGAALSGPAARAERLAAIRSNSQLIAGVVVPPRPEEPDNCCMSGCVNCVWDGYRDEMEWWATANAEADRRLRAQEAGVGTTAAAEGATVDSPAVGARPGMGVGGATAASMDDDGGPRSVANWDIGNVAGQGTGTLTKDFWDDELYKNIPVGIREFMKQEKRLKEKHMKEGTLGG